MTTPNVKLSCEQLEAEHHRLLGRFFVVFASIELNLTLRVGESGTFGAKLGRLVEFAEAKYGDYKDEYYETLTWYMAADSLREVRNRFAHGRWGYLPHVQLVVHVSGYPPGDQYERRFSLSELDLIVKDAELLSKELHNIAWP